MQNLPIDHSSRLFWLPPASPIWSSELETALTSDTSGRLLRGVCSAQLGISQLRKTRSEIAQRAAQGADFLALRHVRLGLLGAGTLDFLADAISGTAPRFGMKIDVAPVQYNSIGLPPVGGMGLDGPLDVVALIPDATSFASPSSLLDQASHAAAVSAAAEVIERLIDTVRSTFACAIILATIPPDPIRVVSGMDRLIPGTYLSFVSDLNRTIAQIASNWGLALWDLDVIAAAVGGQMWRDPVARHVAKSPFAIGLAPFVADRLCAAIAPLVGKSRRALVLDLDNTIWGGVIGDDGLDGIVVGQGDAAGEAYVDVQRYALDLRRRGIVLCVCSKNNDNIAREPFRSHPDMLLREEHIAVFQANWSDKATNIKTISDELALNLDAFVFLDDNPAERARVRQIFPEVAVPELPDDPALFVTCLASGGYFEHAGLSADDLSRADSYQANAKRAEVRRSVGNYDDYLRSLEMSLSVGQFDRVGRARIAQLINKSNQFNLTTRRRQDADVEAIENSPDHLGLQFRLTDVFGDNGMISVVILHFVGQSAIIDTWLMSCRVLERGIEQAVLNEIVRRAKERSADRVEGEYIPSPRNGMVRDHYAKLGFNRHEEENADGSTRWVLDVGRYIPFTVKMKVDSIQPAAHPSSDRR